MRAVQCWGLHGDSTVLVLFEQSPRGARVSRPRAQRPASEPWHSLSLCLAHFSPDNCMAVPTGSAEGIESLGNPCPCWVCPQSLLLHPLLLLPCWLSLPPGSCPLTLSLRCDSEGQRRCRRPRKVTALTLVAGLCSRSLAGLFHTVSLSLRPLIGCVYEHQAPCSAPLLCEGRAAPDG